MRRKLPLLFGAVFLAFAAGACEGPQGERGPIGPEGDQGEEGPPGQDGENALNTCSDCHTSDATLVAIEQQFDLSPHAFGNFEVRGPAYAGGSCVACHTSQGFVANVTDGTADFSDGAASMTCYTCHQIHTTYEGGDIALTTTDPVTLLATGNEVDATGTDVPGSNLCVNCHQARAQDSYPQWDADVATTFNIPSTHYYFHYGPQTNILFQEFPAELSFGLADVGAFQYHEAASCLGCHMGLGSEVADFDVPNTALTPGGELGHNWAPAAETCNQCHGDAAEQGFDYEGVRTDVGNGLLALAQCLESEGVVVVESTDPLHFSPVEGDHPEPYVAAFLMAHAMTEDGSFGTHNPNYVPPLLNAVRTEMDANSAEAACDYTP